MVFSIPSRSYPLLLKGCGAWGGKQQLGIKDRETEAETRTGRARGARTHQGLIVVEQLLQIRCRCGVRGAEVVSAVAGVAFFFGLRWRRVCGVCAWQCVGTYMGQRGHTESTVKTNPHAAADCPGLDSPWHSTMGFLSARACRISILQ